MLYRAIPAFARQKYSAGPVTKPRSVEGCQIDTIN